MKFDFKESNLDIGIITSLDNKLFRLSKEIFFKLLRCIIPTISLFNVTDK